MIRIGSFVLVARPSSNAQTGVAISHVAVPPTSAINVEPAGRSASATERIIESRWASHGWSNPWWVMAPLICFSVRSLIGVLCRQSNCDSGGIWAYRNLLNDHIFIRTCTDFVEKSSWLRLIKLHFSGILEHFVLIVGRHVRIAICKVTSRCYGSEFAAERSCIVCTNVPA